MIASLSPTAQTALIAGLFSLLGIVVATTVPLLGKARATTRRAWLENQASDAREQEASFQRLERENARLTNELANYRSRVTSLETALQVERDLHEGTRRECARMEDVLRGMGRDPDGPDENGGSR